MQVDWSSTKTLPLRDLDSLWQFSLFLPVLGLYKKPVHSTAKPIIQAFTLDVMMLLRLDFQSSHLSVPPEWAEQQAVSVPLRDMHSAGLGEAHRIGRGQHVLPDLPAVRLHCHQQLGSCQTLHSAPGIGTMQTRPLVPAFGKACHKTPRLYGKLHILTSLFYR